MAHGNSATGTTDPDVTSDCQYWANDIDSDDTCAEIESYFGITMTDLKAWDPSLQRDYCVDFVGLTTPVDTVTTKPSTTTTTTTTTKATYPGGIPSPTQSGLTSTCNAYYLVQNGDTCYDIQDIYGDFTLSEFYSWNPSISSGCSGLEPGYYVCVGMASTSTASSTASSTSPYSPQRTGTAANCTEYYFVRKGDSCSTILSEYDISIAEFYSWNPTVGSDCSTMEYGYYVCVGVSASTSISTVTSTAPTSTSSGPSPTQSGITSSCVTYYGAEEGDSCWLITTGKFAYLNETEFIEWNPAVGSGCADLWVGYYYCVATTAVQPMPDIIGTCTQYYLVQTGDSCYSIEQEHSITSTEFYTWNPDVGTDCSALWSGYYVCVGV
ncbi:hypothetical protein BDW66DRAFT_158791 [Aspergillus desertorum]